MFSIFGKIWNAIRDVPYLIVSLLVDVVNGVIAAIGALIHLVLSLFPDMPAKPDAPSSGVLQWINWLLPIGPMLAMFAVFVACWLSFLLIRILARWVKAL